MLTKKMTGIVVALVIVALAATLTATSAFAGENPKERPFSAPVEGSFHPTGCVPDGADLVCDFVLHGEGTATHMGKIVTDSVWVIRVEDIATHGGTKDFIVSGSGTLTGANGDSIDIEAVPGSRLDDGIIDAPFNIVGGTGRFDGAGGLINRVGVFHVVDPVFFVGVFDISYEGVITY